MGIRGGFGAATSSLHQLYINQHKLPQKYSLSGRNLQLLSFWQSRTWIQDNLWIMNGTGSGHHSRNVCLLFWLFVSLQSIWGPAPPIYCITSPRVSFVGGVFFYSSAPFKEPQFPFFHPDFTRLGLSKGDTSGRLRLSSIETLLLHHNFSCQKSPS